MRKKGMRQIIALVLVLVMLFAPASNVSANSKSASLNAKDIVSSITVGWNLGNSMDAYWKKNTPGKDANLSDETIWKNPKVTKELITYVRNSGFNAIRIPVTWYMNSGRDASGKLVVGDKWLARVKEIVDYAMANDMYVIIDSHHDSSLFKVGVTDTASYTKIKNDFQSLWTQVGKAFKDYGPKLMFESFNEIYCANGPSKDSRYCNEYAMEQYNELSQLFVNTIRKTGSNNASRVLVLGCTLDGGSSHGLSLIKRPTDSVSDGLIFDGHFYTSAGDQAIEYKFADYKAFTERTNIPVIIGETGTTKSFKPEEYRKTVATNFVSRAASSGIKVFVWDNGSDYAIIDRKNLSNSNTDMINAYLDGLKDMSSNLDSNFTVVNKNNKWEYKKINVNTGEVVSHNGWGFMTTVDNDGKGIRIPEGATHAVASLSRRGSSWLTEYDFYAFYDKDGKFISAKNKREISYKLEIPSNARYLKLTIYEPFTNVSKDTFNKYFANDELDILVSFVGVAGSSTKVGSQGEQPKVNSGSDSKNTSNSNTSNTNTDKGASATSTASEDKNISVNKAVIKKAKRVKKTKVKVTLKKVKNAKGYSVEVSTSKKFKKKTTVNSKKTTITVKKLKKGKKYYVRARAFAIDSNGKKVYGGYSKIKKI